MIIQPYLEFSIVLCVIIQRPVDIIQFDILKRFEQHIPVLIGVFFGTRADDAHEDEQGKDLFQVNIGIFFLCDTFPEFIDLKSLIDAFDEAVSNIFEIRGIRNEGFIHVDEDRK